MALLLQRARRQPVRLWTVDADVRQLTRARVIALTTSSAQNGNATVNVLECFQLVQSAPLNLVEGEASDLVVSKMVWAC